VMPSKAWNKRLFNVSGINVGLSHQSATLLSGECYGSHGGSHPDACVAHRLSE